MFSATRTTVLITSAALTLAAACATGAETAEAPSDTSATAQIESETPDPRRGEQVNRICFTRSIDNFRAATDRSVIVEKGVNDEYLIETTSRCSDLDRAQSLSFSTFPGSGCVSRGDSIHAYDSVFGPDRTDFPSLRCPIAAIYEWDEEAVTPEGETDREE